MNLGDIRLTPFYDIAACKDKLKEYAEELNRGNYYFNVVQQVHLTLMIITDPTVLPSRGQSGYVITDDTGANIKGELELKFVGETLKVADPLADNISIGSRHTKMPCILATLV